MTSPGQALGARGEELARRHLEGQGLALVEKNVRTAHGEIDLVMAEGDTLVFVEVKTRRSSRFGAPEEAITANKMQKMIDSALAYLQARNRLESSWRLDVVAVFIPPGRGQAQVRHIPNVRV
jgi:putative endonuclease